MTRSKGRTMRADQVRTGDTVLPPSATRESVVQHVRTYRETVQLRYARGATAETTPETLVRVRRTTRHINRDATTVAHTTETETP